MSVIQYPVYCPQRTIEFRDPPLYSVHHVPECCRCSWVKASLGHQQQTDIIGFSLEMSQVATVNWLEQTMVQ